MFKFILMCIVLFASYKSEAQRLEYNKTFCNEDNFPIKPQSLFPQFPAYSMSISSSTYQAGKPISIEVKGCKDNGFRAFLLRASVQGYFLANVDQTFKNKDFQLGTITVTCGVKSHVNNHVEYSDQSPNNILTFRWEPPFGTHGNITFHFTAVPKISSVFWLTFGKSYKQGDENQIIVEQKCASSAASTMHIVFVSWISLLMTSYQWLH